MIKCQVETPTTAKSQANRVTYRRYHKINMDTLRNDLSNCSFVACPVTLQKNCMINTPMIFPTFWTNMLQRLLAVLPRSQQSGCQILTKMPNPFDDSLKTPLNRARLRKQIARCNSLANKDKVTYYRALVNENGDDPKKLWQVLRSALHCIPDKVLPSNSSQKNWLISLPLFSPIRLPKSESLFPVLHPFPCHLQ